MFLYRVLHEFRLNTLHILSKEFQINLFVILMTREDVKLRHLDSYDADKIGARIGNQAHLSILSIYFLCCPMLYFSVRSTLAGLLRLLRSLSFISNWQVKAVIHRNHFLLVFLRKTTKGTEAFVFLSFVNPLSSSFTLFSFSCSPGGPGIHYGSEGGLELRIFLPPLSKI